MPDGIGARHLEEEEAFSCESPPCLAWLRVLIAPAALYFMRVEASFPLALDLVTQEHEVPAGVRIRRPPLLSSTTAAQACLRNQSKICHGDRRLDPRSKVTLLQQFHRSPTV